MIYFPIIFNWNFSIIYLLLYRGAISNINNSNNKKIRNTCGSHSLISVWYFVVIIVQNVRLPCNKQIKQTACYQLASTVHQYGEENLLCLILWKIFWSCVVLSSLEPVYTRASAHSFSDSELSRLWYMIIYIHIYDSLSTIFKYSQPNLYYARIFPK